MEKDRDGEGVWEARGGCSCSEGRKMPLLEEAWRPWSSRGPSASPSWVDVRLEQLWPFIRPPGSWDGGCMDPGEHRPSCFGE